MGKRTWIDSDIWSDTEDLNQTEKVFYLYLLTNSQRNIAGYYKINIRYTAFDLQMTPKEVLGLLTKDTKYWEYDLMSSQVLIPKFTRYNIVKSKQQICKLNAELATLKPCGLHKRFIEAFEEVNGLGATNLLEEKFRRWAV